MFQHLLPLSVSKAHAVLIFQILSLVWFLLIPCPFAVNTTKIWSWIRRKMRLVCSESDGNQDGFSKEVLRGGQRAKRICNLIETLRRHAAGLGRCHTTIP